MSVRSLLALCLFACGIALTAGNRAFATDSNAFDTPTGDRLDMCKYTIAHSFRYDFNQVEQPAAEQAIAAFHLYCRDEIAAMRALAPDWTTPRHNDESIADSVDRSALAYFFNALNDFIADEHPAAPAPPPGGNVLTDHMRWSVFSHPSPLSADEAAYIYRRDAFGWDPYVSFHGTVGSWRYRYEPNEGSGSPAQRWDAYLEGPQVRVWINCNSLGRPDEACRLTFSSRTPLALNFLELQAGGAPFVIHGVCNPGRSGLVLDAPQPDDIDSRHASLTIDDQIPIALPDGRDCVADADGTLATRVLAARRFRSSYAPPFRERIVDNDGTADTLQPALALAQQTYEATRGETAPRILADMAAFSTEAKPFPIEDAVMPYYDWTHARDCLVAASRRSGGVQDAITLEKHGACRNELADLDWRAAVVGAPLAQKYNGDPPSDAAAAARIAATRKALENAVLEQLKGGAELHDERGPFSNSERPALIEGHNGFAGVESDYKSDSSPFEYGYSVSPETAIGAVAERFDRSEESGHAPNGFPTTTIHCRTDAAPRCVLRVPFVRDPGGLRIETDGSRAGAKLCVDSPQRNWKGWTLVKEYSTQDWKLGKDHCIIAGAAAVLTHLVNRHSFHLRAPGEPKTADAYLIDPMNFDLVMALTNYLSSSLNNVH
jgi:hypothetical protein